MLALRMLICRNCVGALPRYTPLPLTPTASQLPLSYLPYLQMDSYRTERVQLDLPTLVIEDDLLRVDVTPQFGGKVLGPPPLLLLFDRHASCRALHAPCSSMLVLSRRCGPDASASGVRND